VRYTHLSKKKEKWGQKLAIILGDRGVLSSDGGVMSKKKSPLGRMCWASASLPAGSDAEA